MKAIVAAHKGRVEIESALGTGSSFTVYFPNIAEPRVDFAVKRYYTHVVRKSRTATFLIILFLTPAGKSADLQPPPLTCPSEDMSSLTCAADAGRDDLVKSILDQGVDVNWPDSEGISALHRAARKGNIKMVKQLVSRGARVGLPDRNGGTPLHWAAKWGHVDVVQFLISRGADVNARNHQGWTALMSAAAKGHGNVVKALLFHQADARAHNGGGESAQTLAEKRRDFATAKMIAAAKEQSAAVPNTAMDKDEMKRMIEQAVNKAAAGQKKAEMAVLQNGEAAPPESGSSAKLKEMVAQLRGDPDNQDLREKIIKLALAMKPPPPLSPQAVVHSAIAEQAFNKAQTPSDFIAAAEDYKRALMFAPWMADLYFLVSVAQMRAGKPDDAIKSFGFAVLAAPNANNAAGYYINRGVIYYHEKDYDKAIEDYSKAIEIDPKNSDAYSNRGGVYDLKKDYDKAFADYSKAIEFNPKNAEAYNNRCVDRALKEDYSSAINDCSKAIELDPNSSNSYESRGDVYFDAGKYDEALADFTKGIMLDGKSAGGHAGLAVVLLRLGEKIQAKLKYAEAIALEPAFKGGSKSLLKAGIVYSSKTNQAFDELAGISKSAGKNP